MVAKCQGGSKLEQNRGIRALLSVVTVGENARYGSLADVRAWVRHVRFTLKRGHAQHEH
jgi:hypothetical protein